MSFLRAFLRALIASRLLSAAVSSLLVSGKSSREKAVCFWGIIHFSAVGKALLKFLLLLFVMCFIR